MVTEELDELLVFVLCFEYFDEDQVDLVIS
jgi:hypothetical protein